MIFRKTSLFIDSHSHVNSFDDCSLSYFENIYDAIDLFELTKKPPNIQLMREFRSNGIRVAAGIHPLEVQNFSSMTEIENVLLSVMDEIDIIGETGVDVFKANNLEDQLKSLDIHIKYAKIHKKPIVIHCRGVVDVDLLLRKLSGTKFVFHCFSYDLATANKITQAEGFVSFSGIVTFKNSLEIQNAAKFMNIEKMLCETDCPYLSPEPLRGKRNEPINVQYTYKYISNLREMDLSDFSEIIKKNFKQFVQK